MKGVKAAQATKKAGVWFIARQKSFFCLWLTQDNAGACPEMCNSIQHGGSILCDRQHSQQKQHRRHSQQWEGLGSGPWACAGGLCFQSAKERGFSRAQCAFVAGMGVSNRCYQQEQARPVMDSQPASANGISCYSGAAHCQPRWCVHRRLRLAMVVVVMVVMVVVVQQKTNNARTEHQI